MRHLFKTTLLTVCIALIAIATHAQDKIYKKDGTVLDSKVKSVGERTIVYKRFDNQDGPEYSILKNEVTKIVYQNGITDVFEEGTGKEPGYHGKHAKFVNKYGKDIISITPISYTAAVDGTINDAGIGICYERLLDERGHIGLNLPIIMNFSSTRDYNNNTFYYNSNLVSYTGQYTSFCFMPGIKFYPAPDREKVRYSLGAAFFCLIGGEPYGVYENAGYGSTNDPNSTYHYAVYGLMISNSVNITATRHFYMAFDLGTGIPFADNRHADNNSGLDLILAPFMQIGFKVGYRY